MLVITPEGYTFVTKFQEDNSHKVLRSVDFFQSNSMKSSSTLFAGICNRERNAEAVHNVVFDWELELERAIGRVNYMSICYSDAHCL